MNKLASLGAALALGLCATSANAKRPERGCRAPETTPIRAAAPPPA
jgi:hypothetical protein